MGPDGLLVVDKPAGMTSHDVVARTRRAFGTRKVGHAGTLDPMATGVLVLGLGRATRLLGYVSGDDKDYTATIRLGVTTVTDDAEGDVLTTLSAAGVSEESVRAGVADLTGELDQVPSSVSAVKVDGERAYRRVRDGEVVDLPARHVVVSRFDVLSLTRPTADLLDVDVDVTCSSGTYVRALARDLGAALGIGGHLTALRRTRVGGFTVHDARSLDEVAADPTAGLLDLERSATLAFARLELSAQQALDAQHGRPVRLTPTQARSVPFRPVRPLAGFDPHGRVVALLAARDETNAPHTNDSGDVSLRVVVGLAG
jgi:tRNA pseudouridine55 synthase